MTKKTEKLTASSSLALPALGKKVNELKKEFQKLKMNMTVQKGPKDVHAPAKIRMEIAQINTLITQKRKDQKQNG